MTKPKSKKGKPATAKSNSGPFPKSVMYIWPDGEVEMEAIALNGSCIGEDQHDFAEISSVQNAVSANGVSSMILYDRFVCRRCLLYVYVEIASFQVGNRTGDSNEARVQ